MWNFGLHTKIMTFHVLLLCSPHLPLGLGGGPLPLRHPLPRMVVVDALAAVDKLPALRQLSWTRTSGFPSGSVSDPLGLVGGNLLRGCGGQPRNITGVLGYVGGAVVTFLVARSCSVPRASPGSSRRIPLASMHVIHGRYPSSSIAISVEHSVGRKLMPT